MKHLSFISACVLSFLLGTIVQLGRVHAQGNAPAQTYFMISFMKTKPGQDALRMEQELWKPIQADRVERGEVDSWTVMQPIFFGPHAYDYMTVETSASIDKLTHANLGPAMTRAWGADKKKYDANFDRTMNARDQVGVELWIAMDGVSKQIK